MMKSLTGHRRRGSPGIARGLWVALAALLALQLQACTPLVVGAAVVGTAAKVAVGAAKVPVKATGAAIDAVTDDEDDEKKKDKD